MARAQPDSVAAYARAVLAGEIIAGQLVIQACQRHLDDLAAGGERGLRFDPVAAQRAIDFFGLLRHSKGRWAGKKFELQPWQQFIVGSLFGWKKTDGTRRFQIGHVEVARKNGKSTLAAGVGLYLLLLDGEQGAEVYTAATKKDQAKIAHEEAIRMVGASPSLKKRTRVFKNNISCPSSNSKFEPLGADSETQDGLNVHGAICDELHAWKGRGLWDVLETAIGAREQPLFLIITTAGYNRHSIWWERRELAVKVLKGSQQDDSLFVYIATLDDGDDWTEEKNWVKGNPSLGVTVKIEQLRQKVEEAKATPGKQNPTKRLRLNMVTDQAALWLDTKQWRLCGGEINEEELRGRQCYGGMDLSATTDLTAVAYLFPPQEEDERWLFLLRSFLPKADLQERCRRDNLPYDVWAQNGWLILTNGNVIDYDVVEATVLEDAEKFQIVDLAFDRYFANQLVLRLQDQGLNVVAFGQGFASMAAPAKELERMVVACEINHGNNPILTMNVGNAAAKQDPAGNTKPDKGSSTGRIDGLVAVLMALGRAILAPQTDANNGGVESW